MVQVNLVPHSLGLNFGGPNRIIIFLILLFGIPALLMWLWNMTMPQLFRVSRIEYWQSFRLFIIIALFILGLRIL